MPKPLIIAHRGDTKNAPENTLPAFASAIQQGADGIELDVHWSKDEHLVVHHFFGYESPEGEYNLIFEKTLADIKGVDVGSHFSPAFSGVRAPTLAEVLDLGKGKIRFEIDLKGSSLPFLQAVIAEIERFGLEDDVELTTAHYGLLSHVKKLHPRLRTGTFFLQPPEWMPLRLAQRHVIDWATLFEIQVPHLHASLLTDDFVDQLRRRGLLVYVFNLSSKEDIGWGLSKGLDFFSTDELEMALQMRDEFVNRSRV